MLTVVSLFVGIALIVAIVCSVEASEQIELDLRQSVAHYNESEAVYNMDTVQESLEVRCQPWIKTEMTFIVSC